MNKYLLSVDIEGITGVAHTGFSSSKGKQYDLARKYMASDVNAVIRGILAVDPDSYILVRDAHGSKATNLDLEKIHPAASVMQGWGDEMNPVAPVDKTYKGVYFIGYHAGGHNNDAVLGHTCCSFFHYVKINGKIVNEAGIFGMYANYYDVPVAFLSGDNQAVKEANAQFDNLVTVTVKESFARDSVLSVSLAKAQELLESGAKQATLNLLQNKVAPMKIVSPVETEIKFYNTGYNISLFQKLYGTLSFDKSYEFDKEQFIVKYSAKDSIEMYSKMCLIIAIVYGFLAV